MKKFFYVNCIFIFLISLIAAPLSAVDFYWENSETITKKDSRFPLSVSNGNTTAVFWQEIDSANKKIWLSAQIYKENGSWRTVERFAGPFSYSGEIPDIYSAAIQPSGKIAVAVLSSVRVISVYIYENNRDAFESVVLPQQPQPLVAPRIYAASGNSFMLFTSLGQNESFSMLYAKSSDGLQWQPFEPFAPTATYMNPFIPVLTPAGGTDLVVFQAQYNTGTRLSYQLYSTLSSDNGSTWSAPQMITGQASLPSGSSGTFYNYNNQRPSLCVHDGRVFVAWERTSYSSENSHIWVESLNLDGTLRNDLQEITANGNANRPVLFRYENTLFLVWFDTRSGSESVYLSQKNGYLWNESTLSSGGGASVFAFPVITDNDKTLSFIWQNNPGKNKMPGIVRLSPDRSVNTPVLTGVTFRDGERGRSSEEQVRVRLPSDPSGIAGFSWVWTQNKYEMPPERLMRLPSQTTVSVTAGQDDVWYFRARVLDYAGNWSGVAEISYFRDTTPPRPPVIMPLDSDAQGFVSSNNFNFSWHSDVLDDDVSGYTWSLVRLDSIPRRYSGYAKHPRPASDKETEAYLASLIEKNSSSLNVAPPPRKILSASPNTEYKNTSNGLYAFSVAAVDTVGNIGEPSLVLAAANKFIPFTVITSAQYKTNIFGNNSLGIFGQGFLYDGSITQIYIDKDGKEPYDYTYYANKDDFSVESDTAIKNLVLGSTVREGKYRIGLMHSDRGLYFSRPIFTIQQNGTVKIESEYVYEPAWVPVTRKLLLNVEAGSILLWIICLLAVTGGVFAVRGIVQTTREGVAVRYEVRALLTGDVMALEKKEKLAVIKKRRGSLRIKLMAFTILLVLTIVVLVAVALGTRMIRTQGETLAEGLQNRISVLLNSMSTGVRTYLPSQNILELSYLPSQSEALSEAEFSTITGFPSNGNFESIDFVWATNDENIASKIDTKTLAYGQSRLNDADIQAIAQKCSQLNEQAASKIGEIATQIASLTSEGVKLALRTDAASVARREEISVVTAQLNGRVTQILNEISNSGASSFPVFDNTHLDSGTTEYLFYKPVLYRQGSEKNYVRGIVFLKVSTETLLQSINKAARSVILSAMLIALFAIVIGSVGAFILATIIVSPIKILEKHVAVIGATKDKSKLANEKIAFKSNDEIGNLRDAVNNMTSELVRAALEEQLALDGRAVQQAFLPLGSTADGGKATTAVLDDKTLKAFGYYEGASGVSGDYFDYKKLDDRWYVFIKCDASGHGVPAALIMTVVATFFRQYFEGWTYKTKGTRLNELLSQINDFIESLGLRGKFAAIILALVDTQTGAVYMSNAGDNIVHIYDAEKRKMKTLTLPEAPAAGPMPSFMVDMKGGFKVEKIQLNKNDILFLYTDGIEESTRLCRNPDFSIVQRSDKDPNGNIKISNVNELMEPERVMQVIEAVMSRGSFVLKKESNPISDEVLKFDFSTCSGTIEEVITALISVEKIFRFYKPENAAVSDVVRVDRKIDAFLQNHFNLYAVYCSQKNEAAADASYVYYTNVMEDEQLDDLTLVAVCRP